MSAYDISPHLLQPSAGDLEWVDRALCGQVDPELFFPPDYDHATDARAVCRGCESRLPCLRWALEHFESGVWGGFTEKSRQAVGRQHRAGLPLEDIIAADDARHYAGTERSAELAAAAAERNRERQRERFAAARAASADLERAS